MSDYQAGDIFVIWGKAATSRVISFLEKTITGMKNPPTHIAIALNEREAVSAEASGIKIVSIDWMKKHSKRMEVYRYEDFEEMHKKALPLVIRKYVGKGYDYWIYLHWALQVLYVFVPFLKIFLFPLEKWLKDKMKRTFECSEVTTRIWRDLGLTFGIKEPQVTTPVDIYQVVTGCDKYDKISVYNATMSKVAKLWYKYGFLVGVLWIILIIILLKGLL